VLTLLDHLRLSGIESPRKGMHTGTQTGQTEDVLHYETDFIALLRAME
jgi:hypothetical protein